MQPLIDSGQELGNRLERGASGDFESIPIKDRVTHSEVDAWFSGCSRIIDAIFGKNSSEATAWASYLQAFDRSQANRTRVGRDFLLMYAERIAGATGFLRQLEAQRLALQIAELFVPAFRALEAEKSLSEAQKSEVRQLVRNLRDEMSRPDIDQRRLRQILTLIAQNAGWLAPMITEIVKIRP